MSISVNEFATSKEQLDQNGYAVVESIFTEMEVKQILTLIEHSEISQQYLKSAKDIFAIRRLLKAIPGLKKVLFTDKLKQLISGLTDKPLFLTKAIYFDKPSESNWFVGYHQDLSISVDEKEEVSDYINWTFKKEQYGVQPPLQVLKDTFTIRIHLDDTTKENGALKVIPKSHLKGVLRTDSDDWNRSEEYTCEVKQGGAMLMKPLTLHASSRTTNNKRRRVVHLEFNCHLLKEPLNWLEYEKI